MVDARLESKVDEHDRMLIEMQTILKGMAESQTKMAGVLLGIAFPIACEIGKRLTFTKTYDLKFIKLSFSQGWENQEVVYGLFQE